MGGFKPTIENMTMQLILTMVNEGAMNLSEYKDLGVIRGPSGRTEREIPTSYISWLQSHYNE